MTEKPTQHSLRLTINGNLVFQVLIGRHYLEKHSGDLSDPLILELVKALDGHSFPVDSTSDGIEYYVADVERETTGKIYRLIWLFEGDNLEVLGVINAYRRSPKKKR